MFHFIGLEVYFHQQLCQRLNKVPWVSGLVTSRMHYMIKFLLVWLSYCFILSSFQVWWEKLVFNSTPTIALHFTIIKEWWTLLNSHIPILEQLKHHEPWNLSAYVIFRWPSHLVWYHCSQIYWDSFHPPLVLLLSLVYVQSFWTTPCSWSEEFSFAQRQYRNQWRFVGGAIIASWKL